MSRSMMRNDKLEQALCNRSCPHILSEEDYIFQGGMMQDTQRLHCFQVAENFTSWGRM